MKSIAILAKRDDLAANGGTQPTQVELHINLWQLRKKGVRGKLGYYLDFGVKATFACRMLRFYFPFAVDKDNPCEGLAERICKDSNLLSAIFNEDLIASQVGDNKSFWKVESTPSSRQKGLKPFLFYALSTGKTGNVKVIEDCAELKNDHFTGSIVDIEVPENPLGNEDGPEEFYIRFRIALKNIDSIAYQSHVSNDFIQAAFSKVDMYDLRFNDVRNLDSKAVEALRREDYEFVSFPKAHIFYVASPKTSLVNESLSRNDTRIVDPQIWNQYMPVDTCSGCTIAYHWKPTNRIPLFVPSSMKERNADIAYRRALEKVNIFFTAKYPKIVPGVLICYFAIIVLLGALASWLVDWGDHTSVDKGMNYWVWNWKSITLCVLAVWLVVYWVWKHIRTRWPFYYMCD